MHDAHRGKGMEVQSPLPPLHSYRIPFQMATKVRSNAVIVQVEFSGKADRGLDWSGRAKARSGLRRMPTFPLPSLKFRTAGFPQYGFKAGVSDRAFPFEPSSRGQVGHCPSCSPLPSFDPRSVPGDVARWSPSVRAAAAALPQGPSLPTRLRRMEG